MKRPWLGSLQMETKALLSAFGLMDPGIHDGHINCTGMDKINAQRLSQLELRESTHLMTLARIRSPGHSVKASIFLTARPPCRGSKRTWNLAGQVGGSVSPDDSFHCHVKKFLDSKGLLHKTLKGVSPGCPGILPKGIRFLGSNFVPGI